MFSSRIAPLLASLVMAGAATAVSTPALASDPIRMSTNAEGRRVAQVSFADLDLTTPDGQRGLNKRVNIAVGRVCRTGRDEWVVERACQSETNRRTRPLVAAAIDRKATQLAMVQVR